ncbi:uncharacterized protein LOC141936255 [Strix uralensis]|uniref:uncharacterized protein LOC141936255 n=1 Tax=Strix uralensis TaxID=36305 RepID=UPI003DA6EBCD
MGTSLAVTCQEPQPVPTAGRSQPQGAALAVTRANGKDLTPKRPLNDSSVSREGQRSWCRVWSTDTPTSPPREPISQRDGGGVTDPAALLGVSRSPEPAPGAFSPPGSERLPLAWGARGMSSAAMLHLAADVPAHETPQRRLTGGRIWQEEAPALHKSRCQSQRAPAAEPRLRCLTFVPSAASFSSSSDPPIFPICWKFQLSDFHFPSALEEELAAWAACPAPAQLPARLGGTPTDSFGAFTGRKQPVSLPTPASVSPVVRGSSFEGAPGEGLELTVPSVLSLVSGEQQTPSPPLRPAAGSAALLRRLLPPSLFSTLSCWRF